MIDETGPRTPDVGRHPFSKSLEIPYFGLEIRTLKGIVWAGAPARGL